MTLTKRWPVLLLLTLPAHAAELTSEQVSFFESKVRPVLVEKCYNCHSLSSGKEKGGLALDTRAGWEKGGEGGPALVPGDVEKSLIIQAVRYTNEDMQMPPKGEKLSDAEIATLEQWVKMGAPDPRVADAKPVAAGGGMSEAMQAKAASHWAYQPVKNPPLPEVKDKAWAANPVDHFVLAALEEKQLTPSAPAEKRTLIRRAYLDMLGLPPTPEQVLAFVRDESPDAFAKVVDALLASPQYGERWGRHWLDVARYADTRGTVRKEDTPLNPHAWTYRDYVIQALNTDKPYDQFIKEQIAADQLGSKDPAALAGLGFLTQGDQFNGQRLDIINDQIDVVTKGFLGMTASCARCHDHFFDPITQRDYYALAGIFGSSLEPEEKPVISMQADSAETIAYRKKRDAMEFEGRKGVVSEMNRIAGIFNRNAVAFLSLAAMDRQAPEYFKLLKTVNVEPRLAGEIAQYLNRYGRRGQRNSLNPTLELWNDLVALKPENFTEGAARLLQSVAEDKDGLISNAAVREVFAGRTVKSLDEARDIYAALFAKAESQYEKESATWETAKNGPWFPGLADAALEEVRTAVFDPMRFMEGDLGDNLRGMPRNIENRVTRITGDLAKFDISEPGSPGLANVLVDDRKPRNARVLIRGQAQNPGAEVPRSFIEVLSPGTPKPFAADASGRLDLAASIASKENPLTARVLVNRVWMHHFGEGLVATPDDLGVMSGAPSHPALLDWLAYDFMEHGWSQKHLHRTILLSRTWQQNSEPNPAHAKVDPFNKLLWRMNVRKLDFESLRDSILSMGGQLDLTMGGRPVNIESEPYSQRRSVYGFIDRKEMAEFMRSFDVANPTLPTGRRHTTIVPQQALFRMNSLLVTEQARNIVKRKEFTFAGNDEERVRQLYEIIYQRWPRPEEVQAAQAYVRSPELGTTQEDVVRDKAAGTFKELTEAEEAALTKPQRKDYRRRLADYQAKARREAMMEDRRGSSGIKEAVRDPSAEKVDRSPLSAWEKYAHALLMTNEMGYVN